MKNEYKIVGDTTVIYIFYKGTRMETIIDSADLEKAKSFEGNWYAQHSLKNKTYYVQGSTRKAGRQTSVFLHRLLCDDPKGMVVDHINHNTLDNRRSCNLRVITSGQNNQNRKIREKTSSKYRGVYKNKKTGKWQAQIIINRKTKYLGSFDCEMQAAKAAMEARLKYYPYTVETEVLA